MSPHSRISFVFVFCLISQFTNESVCLSLKSTSWLVSSRILSMPPKCTSWLFSFFFPISHSPSLSTLPSLVPAFLSFPNLTFAHRLVMSNERWHALARKQKMMKMKIVLRRALRMKVKKKSNSRSRTMYFLFHNFLSVSSLSHCFSRRTNLEIPFLSGYISSTVLVNLIHFSVPFCPFFSCFDLFHPSSRVLIIFSPYSNRN